MMSKFHGEWSAKLHGKNNLSVNNSEMQKEAEKYLAGWKRAMADYDNLHKRMAEDVVKARQNGTEEALRSMLPVVDYFDAALSNVPEEIRENQWVMGVGHIQRAFLDALKTQGVEIITETNVPFDPSIHEAVEHVLDEKIEAGNVIAVVNKGYRLGEKILRAAKVKVVDDPNPPPPSPHDFGRGHALIKEGGCAGNA